MTQSAATEVRGAIASANEEFMAAVKRGTRQAWRPFTQRMGRSCHPTATLKGGHTVQMFWQTIMDMGIKEADLKIL